MRDDDVTRALGVAAGVAAVGVAAAAAARALTGTNAVDRIGALERLSDGELVSLVLAGTVTERDARIWVRHPVEGPLRVTVHLPDRSNTLMFTPTWPKDGDHTTSFQLGDRFELPPGTRVRVSVADADGERVGECRFSTAPDGPGPDRFAFAVVSCHDPFEENGSLHTRASAFMAGLIEALDEHGVERLLMMGDQVYTDLPYALSLFDDDWFEVVGPEGRESVLDCTREEVRTLIQQRYRQFWKVDDWQRIQSAFASATVPDDHEIVDNFGSLPEHASDRWKAFRHGAFDAYHDYQFSRSAPDRPGCFDHELHYGRASVRMLDLRSERETDEERTRILSDPQLRRIEDFLERSADQEVIVIGISIPILHVSEGIVDAVELLDRDGGDFADRWNRTGSIPCRDALLQILHAHGKAHPNCRLVLVGGDVHVGAIGQITWSDGTRPVLQLVTSPVSNEQPPLMQELVQHAPAMEATIGRDDFEATARLFRAGEIEGRNPYGGLNVGVLELKKVEDGTAVRGLLLGQRELDSTAVVLESSWF